jgi:serine phosphatase RsbU (regulator of sigma subunit)
MGTGTVRFDEQLEAIFGLPSGGFDGRFETYQAMLHPEDRGYVLEVVHAAVATRSDYDVEHRCIWPDGSVHWLQGRGSVTLDAEGDVSGTVGCVGDMTERVLARGQAADLSASLQAALLPHLATPPGITVRSRYRPGEDRLLLGGDFLDVAVTPSGNVAFCIGDVGGHGAMPAAVGASLRAGWRALALTGDDPTAWLAGCADVFAASDPPNELFVTMTTGFVSADHRRLVVLSAGHPSPILLGDGAARTLDVNICPPLGLFSKDMLGEPTHVALAGTWTLIMFTDGLFEGYANPGAPERMGVDRIEQWCSELGNSPLDEQHLDALLAFVEDANGGPVGDDIGVLALAASTAETS